MNFCIYGISLLVAACPLVSCGMDKDIERKNQLPQQDRVIPKSSSTRSRFVGDAGIRQERIVPADLDALQRLVRDCMAKYEKL